MKTFLTALTAFGLLAAPLHAQTVTAPTASVVANDECDDEDRTANEDDDCPSGFLLLDGGLGGSALSFALVGAAAVIGIIAVAGSGDDDDNNSTNGSGGRVAE